LKVRQQIHSHFPGAEVTLLIKGRPENDGALVVAGDRKMKQRRNGLKDVIEKVRRKVVFKP